MAFIFSNSIKLVFLVIHHFVFVFVRRTRWQQGLLKAELENIFRKPKPKEAGSLRVVASNKLNDVADLHLTYCLSLSTAVIFYDL